MLASVHNRGIDGDPIDTPDAESGGSGGLPAEHSGVHVIGACYRHIEGYRLCATRDLTM